MKNKIIYIIKETLDYYPPCISQILELKDRGLEVVIVCGGMDKSLQRLFAERNIEYNIIGNKRFFGDFIGKIESYIRFRFKMAQFLYRNSDEDSILWFGTTDSALAMIGALRKRKYVLNVLELYDKYWFYRTGLRFIVHNAVAIIACEPTRARIMKTWWNLKKVPYVLLNKPYFHPKEARKSPFTPEIEKAIAAIQGKKIILYQGIISPDRDLCVLAEALNEMKSDYTLVLMGREQYDGVNKIKKIYGNTIYLGYFPPPQHLQITSYAYIGIANYDDSSLNNLFCAPNKIYEYTGFGIPVLCSNVPGLINTIGMNQAGECVDFTDKQSIIKGIEKIERNYQFYSTNASIFYSKADNNTVFDSIVSLLKN